MGQHTNLNLKNYKVPEFLVQNIELYFDIYTEHTDVSAVIKFYRNPKSKENNSSILLFGDGQEILEVKYNGTKETDYKTEGKNLFCPIYDNEFELSIKNRIYPEKNKSFEGLYLSRNIYCTQCESEAFRKIMYYLDRPDVMTTFKVWIEAEASYEYLLSNGDKISDEILENGRKRLCWSDPHKKPSYLFALVVGNLDRISKAYKTMSGRNIQLEVYVEKGNAHRAEHALLSLEKSFKWDEDRFGREYDLDTYMIVAVDDFNAGAMENKGLNIFNSAYVLASPDTATDEDYFLIESVIGHEYFHNWTGNRITCRDWFQLSLKEGLTVFRDQEFSSDLNSRNVVRIENMDRIRLYQFPEDAGPTAHPIRPETAMSMDNLYTLTIYEKGSEVIRMIHTILGETDFRKAMDLYFTRHDGQAVRTEEFIKCMEDSSGVDLSQFKNWYHFAGTPELYINDQYDPENQTYTLKLRQQTPSTPEQPEKPNFHIPILMGLVFEQDYQYDLIKNKTGDNIDISSTSEDSYLLHIKEKEYTWTFKNIEQRPYLSINRNFSAPVKIVKDWQEKELLSLMAFDSNPLNQREACYQSMTKLILEDTQKLCAAKVTEVPKAFLNSLKQLLKDYKKDPHFTAKCLELPGCEYLFQFFEEIPLDELSKAHESLKKNIAEQLTSELNEIYKSCQQYLNQQDSMGHRALKNQCLAILSYCDQLPEILAEQSHNFKNMTDRMACLKALSHRTEELRQDFFQSFYKDWHSDSLVINKWFRVQATRPDANALEDIKRLSQDPAFDIKNPNKVYALHYAFGRYNHLGFHKKSGEAYRYIADSVLRIDKDNPSVASRLVSVFANWKKFDTNRKQLMQKELQRMKDSGDLSKNTYEIVEKSLHH